MRGHQDAVSRLAWHPTHPDKLASLGQLTEQSVRCAGLCVARITMRERKRGLPLRAWLQAWSLSAWR